MYADLYLPPNCLITKNNTIPPTIATIMTGIQPGISAIYVIIAAVAFCSAVLAVRFELSFDRTLRPIARTTVKTTRVRANPVSLLT